MAAARLKSAQEAVRQGGGGMTSKGTRPAQRTDGGGGGHGDGGCGECRW
ncbi:unnamed protein product [Ectocarpus sp. 8 AP-2014]